VALTIQPLEGQASHEFRLAALHRAHLPDWPPPAIRNDPERYRVWEAAQRVVEAHWTAIGSAMIFSPYPARSMCLGAAQADGSRYRIGFLLFPVFWPISDSQAFAQAVFEVDEGSGELRGWVDALGEGELTEEHRRGLQESGGPK
jgi:hypothetical protein